MEIKDNLRITLAQADLIWENPGQNLENLLRKIMQLVGKTDLLILPEMFTTGFSMNAVHLSEPMDGPAIKWMVSLSHSTGIALAGSLIISDNGQNYNRFVFITPSGEISFYNKRHLFSISGESMEFTAGNQRMIVDFLGWRIALYVCYDIRFPVWCRNVNDTDLMIFTANWPASRLEVWNILLKARAIENQVYVSGVNRIGQDGNGICYAGGSQVLNARGERLSESNTITEGFLTFEISLKELNDFRMKFPLQDDADQFIIV